MEKLNLTAEQETRIHELRLEGLALKIKVEHLREEWEQAKEREKNVNTKALEEKAFFYERDFCGMKAGERITDEFDAYCMGEEIFMNEYLPIVQRKWKELYGLEYPLNYTPTYEQYHFPYLQALKAYRKIAVRFLQIVGKNGIAKQFTEMLNSYLPDKYAKRLDEINEKFVLGGL